MAPHSRRPGRLPSSTPRQGCHGAPATSQEGADDATADEKQIRKWWKRWPAANIGLALNDNFWVLDVDSPDGEQSLARLESQHEPLPLTTGISTADHVAPRSVVVMTRAVSPAPVPIDAVFSP